MLVPTKMGTNMAVGNQQKHLSLSFVQLEGIKKIKIILFSYTRTVEIAKSRNESIFNQLDHHANAASRKSLEIQA